MKFETIETELDAYWLGYIMADGYVHNKGKMIQFTQSEQDKDNVYKLMDYIGKGAITKITSDSENRQDLYMLSVYSVELVDNLKLHGCINNKSLTLRMPDIKDELIWHFIRGYFDGDGCIYSKIRESDGSLIIESPIVMSDNFASKFIDILKSYDINFYVQKLGKNQACTTVKITGLPSNAKFYDLLYTNATIKNERKYEKFLLFIKRLFDYGKSNKKTAACKILLEKYISQDQ